MQVLAMKAACPSKKIERFGSQDGVEVYDLAKKQISGKEQIKAVQDRMRCRASHAARGCPPGGRRF